MVEWEPVPNARPGSISRSISAPTGSSHGGRTYIRSATSTGRWNAFQRSSQSSGTPVPLTTTRTPGDLGLALLSSGSSPGAP